MAFSVQNIIGTPLNQVAESNIALAHVNFDFSLFKCEAPVELLPLGRQLSKARRETAEDGSFHILARRLGVLFDDVLPDVPVLLEAYGTRASDIVQETMKNIKNSKVIVDGFFGGHLGIDSTTIWASATSGKSVLRIHLLACLLARIWSPQEATAIWSELVAHRQSVIKSQAQSADIADNYLAQIAAAHEIDRDSLGSWDASARAWLEVADQARRKEQIRVRLIVNNLSIGIKSQTSSDQASSPKIRSYESVLLNLNRALSTLEKLIKGEPQRITDGGILLGLISWHIYPDLVVLGTAGPDIKQNDTLVKASGIVTISVAPEASPRTDGVYWSLPLASLKYYGTVQRERSTMRNSPMSVTQLQALVLGASLGADDSTFIAAKILQSLWNVFGYLYKAKLYKVANQPLEMSQDLTHLTIIDLLKDDSLTLRELMKLLHLLLPFQDGIKLLLSEEDHERNTARQLMRYGNNYGKSWIGNTIETPPNFFGLATFLPLLRVIKIPNVRVKVLRARCKHYSLSPSRYVIRYRTEFNSWAYTSTETTSSESCEGRKRKWDQFQENEKEVEPLEIPSEEDWICLASLQNSSSSGENYYNPYVKYEITHKQHDMFSEWVEETPRTGQPVVFDFAFGDHSIAAVYERKTTNQPASKTFSTEVPLEIVQDLLEQSLLNLDLVAEHLLRHFSTVQSSHGTSLLALGWIVDYYKHHLPHATISMGMIKTPIRLWDWTQSLVKELELLSPLAEEQARERNIPQTIYPKPLSREYAFAAILQFESGDISVDITKLAEVLAISSGNSLFIADQLLHDPISPRNMSPGAVSHVIGNVGKPGVTLLISPPELEIREHDVERWHFINHNPFDGESCGGRFDGTSLHMSFTGWEGPVSLESSNSQGMEAYYVETVVSINDWGQWVGDIDILKGLRNLEVGGPDLAGVKCIHDPSFAMSGLKMISIDCWEEILDPPTGVLVLRSTPATHGRSEHWQWMVRLAATSVGFSRKYKCICLPVDRPFCWTCVAYKMGRSGERNVLLIF